MFERGLRQVAGLRPGEDGERLFAVQLDALGQGAGVRAFAVHPGGIMTPLQRHLARARRWSRRLDRRGRQPLAERFKTPEQGAATATWAATSPQLDGLGGVYCEDCDIAEPWPPTRPRCRPASGPAIDPDEAARLWALSAELTGVDAFAAP